MFHSLAVLTLILEPATFQMPPVAGDHWRGSQPAHSVKCWELPGSTVWRSQSFPSQVSWSGLFLLPKESATLLSLWSTWHHFTAISCSISYRIWEWNQQWLFLHFRNKPTYQRPFQKTSGKVTSSLLSPHSQNLEGIKLATSKNGITRKRRHSCWFLNTLPPHGGYEFLMSHVHSNKRKNNLTMVCRGALWKVSRLR